MGRKEAVDANSRQLTETGSSIVTRRSFLVTGVAAVGATAAMGTADSAVAETQGSRTARPSSFLDLLRVPDAVTAFQRFEQTIPAGRIELVRRGERWTGERVEIETKVEGDALKSTLHSPVTPIAVVHMRWLAEVVPMLKLLSDAWERSYGELGWRNVIPERVLPWYFATFDGELAHAYGVKTDARALCFWQLDPQGASLWLNVANGGSGVELGDRVLAMATIVSRQGGPDESAADAVAGLCRAMCARTTRVAGPVYGANDWCYSYGNSTAESILKDTDFIVEVSPSGGTRPFSVIDGGWTNGTAAWPDMGTLATAIKERNARPGIWVRPLEAPANAAAGLLLPGARFGDRKGRSKELAYDPTVSDARENIQAKLRQAAAWGYEMVKHDFSTYDLLGQWGFEMGPQPTLPGWSLHDRSSTNAEVIADLYALIREGVGERIMVDGCNTVGHLGQGVFEVQRIGDDTSGHQWERTRRMGVNTLSFRLPQNDIFFKLDPDLVGLTEMIPWELNRQWLDVLARSGAATMVSAAPSMRGRVQKQALREAFQVAAAGGTGARPADLLETSAPEQWREIHRTVGSRELRYRWNGVEGASPFLAP